MLDIMKILNGSELAGFIKERQAKQVRALRQASHINPKLVIIQAKDDPVINTYVRLKKQYGSDIQVDVDTYMIPPQEIIQKLQSLNKDKTVHGIIIQLPLNDPSQTEEIVNQVAPAKDVDALGAKSKLNPATPLAIIWLLAGYNVELNGKHILLVGRGRLVGAPLEKMLLSSGYDVETIDKKVTDLSKHTLNADVIISATGSPSVLHADMIKKNTVVVDAGVASESGKTVGDLADDVYERDDLTLTPRKGGVGPLTVCALFDNVIRATRQSIKT